MPKVIEPKALGAPLGLYSHGMLAPAGELLVVAGQVGIGPSGAVANDIVAQTKQALANVRAVVEAAGCTMRDVVRFQTFLTRADDIPGYLRGREEVYAECYPNGPYPPNTLLVITRLVRPEILVEIEAMAVRTARPSHRGRVSSTRPHARAAGSKRPTKAKAPARAKRPPR